MAGSDSTIGLPADGSGKKLATRDLGGTLGHVQHVMPRGIEQFSFVGFSGGFRIPGRAATTQKLLAIHNATASPVNVNVDELSCSVERETLLTTLAPILRLSRFTVLPTGGTALAKVQRDTGLTSDSHVVVTADAQADGTPSASALTVTVGNAIRSKFSPRMVTLAGGVPAWNEEFIDPDRPFMLRPLEGVCLHVIAVNGTDNPATLYYLPNVAFSEFTT